MTHNYFQSVIKGFFSAFDFYLRQSFFKMDCINRAKRIWLRCFVDYFHGTLVLHEDQITWHGSQICIAYGTSIENTNNEETRIVRTQFRGHGNCFTTGFRSAFFYSFTHHLTDTEIMGTGDQLAGYDRFISIFSTAAVNHFRLRGIVLIDDDVTRQIGICFSFTATPLEHLLENFPNVGIDVQFGIYEEFTISTTPGTIFGVQTVFSNDEILQNLERTFVFNSLALGYVANTANVFHEELFIDTPGFTYMYTVIAVPHPVATPETVFTEEETTSHPEPTFVLTSLPLDHTATAANVDQFATYITVPTNFLTIAAPQFIDSTELGFIYVEISRYVTYDAIFIRLSVSYFGNTVTINYQEHSARYQQNTVSLELFYYY